MMTTGMWIGLAAVVLVLFAVSPPARRAFRRIFGAAEAQVDKFGRRVGNADPLANLQKTVDDGVAAIQKAQKGLVKSAAAVRSAQRAVNDDKEEMARLESRIRAAVDNNDPNGTLVDYANEMAQLEENLKTNEEELARCNQEYKDHADTIEMTTKAVKEARKESERLGRRLAQSEAAKEAVDFGEKFDPEGFMSEYNANKEAIQQQIDENLAARDAANATNRGKLARQKDDELARKAKAQEILARYKKPE